MSSTISFVYWATRTVWLVTGICWLIFTFLTLHRYEVLLKLGSPGITDPFFFYGLRFIFYLTFLWDFVCVRMCIHNMCVCTCAICVYVRLYVYLCVGVYVCVYVCIRECVYNMCVYVYNVCAHRYVCICVYVFVHMCLHVCNMCTCTHIMYIICMCTYVCNMCVCLCAYVCA